MTGIVFIVTAALAGANAVAIRMGSAELAPLWAAAVRFLAAAVLLLAAMAILRIPFPRGRAFAGAMLFGTFSFAGAFGFIYQALTEVTAGTAMVGLATVPMLTLVFAVAAGVERLRLRSVIGALVAAAGIVLVFADRTSAASPGAVASLLVGAACLGAAPVVIKAFPKVHAVAENAIGMATGGVLLVAASLVAGEPKIVPARPETWATLGYLVVFGSVGVFMLFLHLVRRMTASAANYIMLVAPLFAMGLGALVLGEPLGATFLAGAALVIGGVFLSATAPRKGQT